MRRPYARGAAAAGIDFAVVFAAIGVIERWKKLNTPGEIAVHASNNIFASVALLYGVAAVFLFWFGSTLAARMRQLEGGSGRLAAAVNASASVIAGVLAIGVGIMWAAHQIGSPDSAAMATSVMDGPTLFFPFAVLVGASGVVGFRAQGLPLFSRWVSRASIPLAAAFVAGAGLMLFKNYAWINDLGNIVFGAWILVLSIIGIARWGDLDGSGQRAPVVERVDPVVEPDVREPEEEQEEDEADEATEPPVPARRAPRKPEPRKPRERRKFAPRNVDRAREVQERLHAQETEAEVDDVDEDEEPEEEEPFFLDVTHDEDEEDEDDDDLIEDVGPMLRDTDEEGAEEFQYGGPPRLREPVDVTPARRPGHREPKKPTPRKPAAAKKTAPRKPKPAPRKPRAPRARRPEPVEDTPEDTTEIIPEDER